MSVTGPEQLRALARLARLELDAEETARLAPELERILAAFAVLARHPAAPPGPMESAASAASPAPAAARRRGDEPQPSLPRERLLSAASEREDGFYAVPKTVGGER